jgi:pimeloyl-ACP methyl ester carboxylesterase
MTRQPDFRSARGNGVDLRYALWEGAVKTILCIHGLTANCRCWDGIIETLSPPHRAVAVDLRGRGGSGKPDQGYSLLDHIGDLHRLLDALAVDSAVLMGHSLGAFIAEAFAARFPDRVERLVLFDGGGRLTEGQLGKVMEGIRPALLRLGTEFSSQSEYIDTLKETPALQPWNPVLDACYRYETETTPDGVRCNIDPRHMALESENLKQTDVRYLYPHILCETLILKASVGLSGSDGHLLPQPILEQMLREIPRAKAVEIEGLNHYGIVFQPHPERDRTLREFIG